VANLNFAQAVEPNNLDLPKYQQLVKNNLAAGINSIPTTLAVERRINPFLRAGQEPIKLAIKHQFQLSEAPDTATTFKLLRQWKDNF
jgi:hydroxyacylglutathione hydrolase